MYQPIYQKIKKIVAGFIICEIILSSFSSSLYASEMITNAPSGQSSTLSNPTIIPLGESQNANGNLDNLQHAYQYIFGKTSSNKSDLLVYPENFSYRDSADANKETVYPDGALIKLNSETMPASGSADYFKYLQQVTTADLGRSKALYDGNIAILNMSKVINNTNVHLTYESEAYCNVLHTYLHKNEQCFYGYIDYEKYLADSTIINKEATSIVFATADDIQNNLITSNRFSLLILPDITFGRETEVLSELGDAGLKLLADYVKQGGTILASGKANWLLQASELVAANTVNKNIVVKNKTNRGVITFNNKTEFENKVFQLGLLGDTKDVYFLSNFLINAGADADLNEVGTYQFDNNYSFQDATTLKTIAKPQNAMTAIAWKNVENGKIIMMNAQPAASNARYFPYVLNSVFLANSKSIIANLNVVQKVNPALAENIIPALENNVKLLTNFEIRNFYNESISSVSATIWVAKGFKASDVNTNPGCVTTPLSGNVYYDEKIVCSYDTLAAFESKMIQFPMMIIDPSVTQKMWGILAASGDVDYTTLTGKQESVNAGGRYLTAYRGAEIRAEYNPDPSSFYPLKGQGVYIDNVLTAENKEATNADEVEHIAVVPLIAPLVDGNNQGSLAYTIEFDNQNYQVNKKVSDPNAYVFPFKNSTAGNRDYDYIDYKSLKCTDAILAADWDTPVKSILSDRTQAGFPNASCSASINNIVGKDYAFNVNNEELVAKQVYYNDIDNYYEHATQRQMVYLDTTKPSGAAVYYGGSIPTELQNGTVAKKQLSFARNDIYFYNNANYPLPEGVTNSNSFFTIDRYNEGTCGDSKGILVPGYYDDTKENGIKSNEYDNQLECKQGKTRINYENITASTGGKVALSHYLFPINDVDNIKNASDLANFDPTTGAYNQYSEVKFVKAHTVDFTLDQSTTQKGGKFTFTLPAGVNFNSNPEAGNLVTFSADHLAVRKIKYDTTQRAISVEFIRGKMPDQTDGKPDVLRLNLENLDTESDISLASTLESLNYDLGSASAMTVYTPVTFTNPLTLTKKPFLSLPSVIMKFRLKRDDGSKSYFQKYEYFEPFVRYGVYIQELTSHRTVYAYTENHPVTDPGLVVRNASFSTFSNIGSSSIPFREYLQTGTDQVIPSSPETSRVDYQDIWKRQWTTPIRTVLPDVPPIPPPLRNFMMNTTFEIKDKATGATSLEWASDKPAEVLYKIKLYNNYPKYFDPTVCKANEKGDLSHDLKYGVCYQTPGDKVDNQVLTDAQRLQILNAQTCTDKDNCPDMTGIPTITRRPEGQTGGWNNSQAVNTYFPNAYTNEAMWSLTHYDYDDTPYAKGYPYHMDNVLPNYDTTKLGILRPQNIIAQPIFKGVGFSQSYDKNYVSQFFKVGAAAITGWMSDNLQNKDNTLLGGQSTVNEISVDKTDLMTGKWTDISGLQNNSSALNNIYACQFNRWRANVSLDASRIVYPNNVYKNNIIPIIPSLDKNDSRLTTYVCGTENYSPETIHEVDNVVKTDAKDWLYFGAGLRGGAKEAINIVSQLNPISGITYEGFAKINDGGRFVYWNPANGPNSFIVLDNVVNVVEALQSRLSVAKEIIPVEVPTFNADIYHLITVNDPDEYQREFTESPFLKHYGFGDTTTSVQVGTAQNLQARGSILNANEETTVKIDLFNNSGYDWNMIKTADGRMAIESTELPSAAINANDLLNNTKHAIRSPEKFNFLQFAIPAEIADYVEYIRPATSNINVAGILFDFENINVTTIKDGFKGSYYVDVKLKSTIPDSIKGKTYDIGVSLVPDFFDRYPGHTNDPVAHTYSLLIPSIRIGIPYGSNKGSLSGKVYRTSGYSTELKIEDEFPVDVDPQELQEVTWTQLQALRTIAANPTLRQQNLDTFFKTLNKPYTFTKTDAGAGVTKINVDLAANGTSQFPIKKSDSPDQSTLYLIARSKSSHLSYGEKIVNQNLIASYKDFSNTDKHSHMSQPLYRKVQATGADLISTYSAQLIGKTTGEVLAVQKLSKTQENTIQLEVRIQNNGSGIAYYPTTTIQLPADIVVQPQEGITVKANNSVEIALDQDMAPGDVSIVTLTVTLNSSSPISLIKKVIDYFSRNVFAAEMALIVDHVDATFDLTSTQGENTVSQQTAGSFLMEYADELNPEVALTYQKNAEDTYRITLAGKNSPVPYYKLFRKDPGASSFVQVSSDYSTDGLYSNIHIQKGTSQLYGALYRGEAAINTNGEEYINFVKVAESAAISLTNNTTSGGSTSSSNQNPSAPVCTHQKPTESPRVSYSAVTSSSVKLSWNAVQPATKYGLYFKRLADGAEYGLPDLGNRTEITVEQLGSGTAYEFGIYGINNCAPGPMGKVKVKTTGATQPSFINNLFNNVLGSSTKKIENEKPKVIVSKITPTKAPVQQVLEKREVKPSFYNQVISALNSIPKVIRRLMILLYTYLLVLLFKKLYKKFVGLHGYIVLGNRMISYKKLVFILFSLILGAIILFAPIFPR